MVGIYLGLPEDTAQSTHGQFVVQRNYAAYLTGWCFLLQDDVTSALSYLNESEFLKDFNCART